MLERVVNYFTSKAERAAGFHVGTHAKTTH